MEIKYKYNENKIPDSVIKSLARFFYPQIVEFYESEEGQKLYEQWQEEKKKADPQP